MAIVGERESALIQIVAELGRGVAFLQAELKQGDFTGSRDSARALKALVELADKTIRNPGRERVTAPSNGSDSAAPRS